uniref:Exoribonuclease phosphorolytic domain-containing protein n=1 Tax=Lynx canadensis TaxID=61383 RepID=A0A667HEI8_LYNCA
MPMGAIFAFFRQGTYLLGDPNKRDERVTTGLLVIAMNKHREICTIQSCGGRTLLKHQLLRYSKTAGVKGLEITELTQKALENDWKVQKEGGRLGFAGSIGNQRITAFKVEKAAIDTSNVEEKAEEIIAEAEPPSEVVFMRAWVAQSGMEDAWGDDENFEKEEENGGAGHEAIMLNSIKRDTEVEVSNTKEMIVSEPAKNPKKIRTETISAKLEKPPSKKLVKKRKEKRAANQSTHSCIFGHRTIKRIFIQC